MNETTGNDMITDAFEDQDGNKFLCFGRGEKSCCVPLVDLHSFDKKLVERLERAGVTAIQTSAKEAIKAKAQSVADFRKVSVAGSPGWAAGVYASPEGSLLVPPGHKTETIVAFEPDSHYKATTDLAAWQEAVEPFVRQQPLLLFGLAFSLVGPLLRFAPPDLQNPVIEFVGAKEKGKSTLAKLMSSVWGGNPDALLGICLDWDFSPAEIDGMRASRRDGLLVLDEVNRAAKDEGEKAKIVSSAIFKLADSSSRKRFGEPEKKPIRQAVVSTSNVPIRELTAMPAKTKEAMLSRILSIECARPLGIFDELPPGYADAGSAARALNAAVTAHCGSPAVAFISNLVRYEDDAVRKAIFKGMRFAEAKGFVPIKDARKAKTVAVAYAAGRLAQQFGVIPAAWGCLDQAFLAVFAAHGAASSAPVLSPALRAITAYIELHGPEIRLATCDGFPVSSTEFKRLPGIWLKKNGPLVVSPSFLQGDQGVSSDVLKKLRDEGRLDCEQGQLTKKAPRQIATGGRAHFINIEPNASSMGRRV